MLQERSGHLVVDRCWCGIQHAIPMNLHETAKRHRDEGRKPVEIYCPLGHSYIKSGESKVDELNRRLAAERARHDQTRAELRSTEAKRRAHKAVATKLKKRAAAGMCPCCETSFPNLREHMVQEHPEFREEENDDAS